MYQILKRNIISNKFNLEFTEMCIITILQLLSYVKTIKMPLFNSFSEQEIMDCMSIIQDLHDKCAFPFVGQEVKDTKKLLS